MFKFFSSLTTSKYTLPLLDSPVHHSLPGTSKKFFFLHLVGAQFPILVAVCTFALWCLNSWASHFFSSDQKNFTEAKNYILFSQWEQLSSAVYIRYKEGEARRPSFITFRRGGLQQPSISFFFLKTFLSSLLLLVLLVTFVTARIVST